jgi:hypothetical protein
MTRNNLLILTHLGLGDAIIINAIVREKAKVHDLVCLPVKYHNVPSVVYMLRDLDNVTIRPVEHDEDMLYFAQNVWKWNTLWLGQFGPMFDPTNWDVSMFRQAQVEFSDRWGKWECPRDEKAEHRIFDQYGELRRDDKDRWVIFLHEDPSRGFKINRGRWGKLPEAIFDLSEMPGGIKGVRTIAPISLSNVLFHWRKVIEACDEIHCIPSSFAAFIDSIPLPKNPKLFLHAYARPREALMKVQKNWEILT